MTPTSRPELEETTFIWQRIHDQQEIRDRWFKYSLTILAVPLLIASAAEKAEFLDKHAVALVMAIFAFVGFFFLLLYTRQRINSIILLRRLENRLSDGEKAIGHLDQKPGGFLRCLLLFGQRWGADFFANCIQGSMNAGLVIASLYYFGLKGIRVFVFIFLVLLYIQLFIRQMILRTNNTD